MSDSIKIRELVSGPSHYEEQEITFDYICDLWDEGDIPYELVQVIRKQADEIERLQEDLGVVDAWRNKVIAENERLRAKCNQRRDDLKQARDILDERFKEIERLRAAVKAAGIAFLQDGDKRGAELMRQALNQSEQDDG